MLSVTLPALARIVDLLNLSFDLSAESLYVAAGAAGATVGRHASDADRDDDETRGELVPAHVHASIRT